MFNKNIDNIILASNVANIVFPNILGDPFSSDTSFVATLRALLAPRFGEEDRITVRYISRRGDSKSAISSTPDESCCESLAYSINGTTDTIYVFGLHCGEEANKEWFKKIDSAFMTKYQGFVELKDLKVFVSKQANMRFFINEETRVAAVFVDGLNTRLWHLVQSLTSRLIPWHFKDKPLEEDERLLVKSLTSRSSTEYELLIEAMAKKFDFRTKKVEHMLSGFEKSIKQLELRNVERNISSVNRRIEDYLNGYSEYIKQREALFSRKLGLMYQVDNSGENELLDYFLCNKHLDLVDANEDGYLRFIVGCHLTSYDPEMYERFSKNDNSYFYGGYDVSCDKFKGRAPKKMLLDAIFGDDSCLKIKMCSFYEIHIGGGVEVRSGYNYPADYKDFIPNPHIHYHSCLGDHRRYIENCLLEGDNIGAIEQCVSSARSVNIGEDITFVKLLRDLFSDRCGRVIELPDGTSCTPSEALDWLAAQKEEEVE